jgi:hypothetical protein
MGQSHYFSFLQTNNAYYVKLTQQYSYVFPENLAPRLAGFELGTIAKHEGRGLESRRNSGIAIT